MFGAKPEALKLEGIPARGENLYFAGCNARFKEKEIAAATLKVLQSTCIDVAYLADEERCCGFIAGHDGNTQLLENQAVNNVEAIIKTGAKRVITSCAHCYKTLKKDYPLITGKLPFEVTHITEILAGMIEDKKIRFSKLLDKEITFHDACFMGRHCGIYEEPREILSKIPGIKVKEMERNRQWSLCCGSGAKITSNCYPEFSLSVTRERLLEGKNAANIIVTACTSCFSHMNEAVKKDKLAVEIQDIVTLVAQAKGIEI
jgi:Fe-S oxidoreductase